MGTVSYKLMKIIIVRKLKAELHEVMQKYKTMGEALDKTDPHYMEKLLEYSNQMFAEMNKIQDAIKQKYKKELEELQ